MSTRMSAAAFNELVSRLRTDASNTGSAATPGQVGAQVDALLRAAARPSPPTKTGTNKSKGESAMRRTTKTKTTTKRSPQTTRQPRPVEPPKPRATIELAPDLAAMMNDPNARPTGAWPRPSRPEVTSAHGVDGQTPCYTCGGACEHDDDQHGPWREHRECAPLRQVWDRRKAAALFLAVPLTDLEARVATLPVPAFAHVHNHSTSYDERDHDRSPWAHVDRPAMVRSVMEARRRISEETGPAECVSGRCAWCGRREAEDWRLHGHRWDDGTEAPLCGECGAVFERRSLSATYPDDDRYRAALAEALSGVPAGLGARGVAGLEAFHEVGEGGSGEPWDYLPADALDALRLAEWARFAGRYAPEDRRAEALALRADQEAARSRAVAQAVQGDPYGFYAAKGERQGQP